MSARTTTAVEIDTNNPRLVEGLYDAAVEAGIDARYTLAFAPAFELLPTEVPCARFYIPSDQVQQFKAVAAELVRTVRELDGV